MDAETFLVQGLLGSPRAVNFHRDNVVVWLYGYFSALVDLRQEINDAF
jgi:hypothetical protein